MVVLQCGHVRIQQGALSLKKPFHIEDKGTFYLGAFVYIKVCRINKILPTLITAVRFFSGVGALMFYQVN